MCVWFCIAVVCQECSVLDYVAVAIQCAELSGIYAYITLCLSLHVVKSARPSAPQGFATVHCLSLYMGIESVSS